MSRLLAEEGDRVAFTVYVKPEARFTGFRVEAGDIVFYTTEPAVAGREEASLVGHLSRLLRVPPSMIEVSRGLRGSARRVRVRGRGLEEVARAIARDALRHAHEVP